MIEAFNKATKKFTDYFTYIESEIDFPHKDINESIIAVNDNILLWQYDTHYTDDEFIQIFNVDYKTSYLVYNISPRKIVLKPNLSSSLSRVIDFKAPEYSSYTLTFLISFCISIKDYLGKYPSNKIIIHDNNNNGKIICLLSTLLSFINTTSVHPMETYGNLITGNKALSQLSQQADVKNNMRYLNYFANVQSSPIMNMKKLYLKSILINSSPAIDNIDNISSSPYLTINKNSYYAPVIRIFSNEKLIYCSYAKDKPVERVFYSPDNCIKFDINGLIFGDTVVEILHKGEAKFKQLIVIQFHSFFLGENAMRFTRDQIDGACNDIRYPEEFFIDLLFDQTKDVSLSSYDEDSIKWKNVVSEFITKSNKIKEEIRREVNESQPEEDEVTLTTPHEEIMTNKTVNEVQEMLNKMDTKKTEKTQEEDDDEDMDAYLKNLENQSK